MESSREPRALIVPPDGGRLVEAMGEQIRIKLGVEETAGSLGMYVMDVPPGGGPPLHYHDREAEWFFPLEGEAEFWLNGDWVPVVIHSVVYLPRGVPHTFRNAGTANLKLLVQLSPGGFEKFFEAAAPQFNRPEGPDFAKVGEISEGFGVHYLGH